MKLNLKSILKTDLVKGLNISKLAEGAFKSAVSGATSSAASMVAGNKEIQARATAVAEEQAVAGIAGQIAKFYKNNKVLVFAGIGTLAAGGIFLLVRGLMPRRRR